MSSPLVFAAVDAAESYMAQPSVNADSASIIGIGMQAIALLSVIILFSVYAWRSRTAAILRAKLERSTPYIGPDLGVIAKADATFREAEFLSFVRETFHLVQHTMATGRTEDAHHVMADDFFYPFAAVISAQANRRRQAVVENLKIHEVVVRSAINLGNWDCIVVRFVVSCSDYEVDDDGRVFGNRRLRAWQEDWTFERATDQTRLRQTWGLTNIEAVDTNRFRGKQEPVFRSSASERFGVHA